MGMDLVILLEYLKDIFVWDKNISEDNGVELKEFVKRSEC